MALADVATVLAEEAGEVAAQAAELQQRLLRLSERLEEEQDGRLPEHLAALGYETILWRDARISVPDNGQPVLAAVAWQPAEGVVDYAIWPAVWRDGVGWRIQLPNFTTALATDEYIAYWCAMPRVPGIEGG